ncbi:MAG TPA: alpha/beta hydrolase [Pyrinomonadaceae bacterium]|nr:alpha/beta hydrolase [Pyrinomonadaceae bacterium]
MSARGARTAVSLHMVLDSHDALARGKRKRIRRLMLIAALILVAALPLLYLAARRFERMVVFRPLAYYEGPEWSLPERGEDVWFETSDGVRLHGWFVSAYAREPAEATVVYFHGNGGNLSYLGWLASHLSRRGFDVLLFDYRGYGRSSGAVTDEAALYADADAAYDFVTRSRGARPETVVLYGQSLGTAAATDVASRRTCGALVLESGLSSASDMAARILPFAPRWTHRLGRNRLDSARKLATVNCPVLIAHGERDETIPVEQGRALYAAAREPKRLRIVAGAGHNDLVATAGGEYLDELASFIRESIAAHATRR